MPLTNLTADQALATQLLNAALLGCTTAGETDDSPSLPFSCANGSKVGKKAELLQGWVPIAPFRSQNAIRNHASKTTKREGTGYDIRLVGS